MKKKIIEYIREEGQCNYADVLDYMQDINTLGSAELKKESIVELLFYIEDSEQSDTRNLNTYIRDYFSEDHSDVQSVLDTVNELETPTDVADALGGFIWFICNTENLVPDQPTNRGND